MDTLIGISLILAGSIWFLWSLHSLWKGRESEDWNITTGIITKSKVFEPYTTTKAMSGNLFWNQAQRKALCFRLL